MVAEKATSAPDVMRGVAGGDVNIEVAHADPRPLVTRSVGGGRSASDSITLCHVRAVNPLRGVASIAERIVAVEGARGFGLALARRLLPAGEAVVDVAPTLTASERRAIRGPGKDDQRDAVAVARIGLREQGLPRLAAEPTGGDLKLLVDARDQLVAEATRTRNRLHALLVAIAPGYHEHIRDLTRRTLS